MWKILRWSVVMFIIFLVATDPSGASHALTHVGNGFHDAAGSLAAFVNSL
jgi:hypothetical protein